MVAIRARCFAFWRAKETLSPGKPSSKGQYLLLSEDFFEFKFVL
jgi:hypothetical protein